MDLVELAIGLGVILLGAELFTNGIEWVGRKLDLAEGAVGSVLAAVGTALPETMIPLVAILLGGGGADGIGVGAILGAPFMLATLAMFVTGTAALAFRRRRTNGAVLAVDTRVLSTDIRAFVGAYSIAIAAALLPGNLAFLKWVAAACVIGLYVRYVRIHFAAESDQDHEDALAPLRLHRLDRRAPAHPAPPRLRVVTLQVAVALGCIVGGATVFVAAVEHLSAQFGIDGALLALVVAPIATELPEKLNSVIWVRRGKDTLALGNITGAMVFQSAFPVSVALVFAPAAWTLNGGTALAFASAAITGLSVAVIFGPAALRHRLTAGGLLAGGLFYAAYLGVVVVAGARPG